MKNQDRKERFAEIIGLMLQGKNKQAYTELVCMCGEDTGLFIMADYDKAMITLNRNKDRLIDNVAR